MSDRSVVLTLTLAAAVVLPRPGAAQGTVADYERADTVAERTDGLVVDLVEAPHWIAGNRFWYRKSVKGGNVFVLVDATAAQKRPAFDHEKIATGLSAATGHQYTAVTLPFRTITFGDGDRVIDVEVDGVVWRCSLAESNCAPGDAAPGGRGGAAGGGRGGGGRGGVAVADEAAGAAISRRSCSAAATGEENSRVNDESHESRRTAAQSVHPRLQHLDQAVGSADAMPLSLDARSDACDLRSVSWSRFADDRLLSRDSRSTARINCQIVAD